MIALSLGLENLGNKYVFFFELVKYFHVVIFVLISVLEIFNKQLENLQRASFCSYMKRSVSLIYAKLVYT